MPVVLDPSRRHTWRQISMISRVRATGLSYATPWKPSITCGPGCAEPQDRPAAGQRVEPAAVIAMSAGVRL